MIVHISLFHFFKYRSKLETEPPLFHGSGSSQKGGSGSGSTTMSRGIAISHRFNRMLFPEERNNWNKYRYTVQEMWICIRYMRIQIKIFSLIADPDPNFTKLTAKN